MEPVFEAVNEEQRPRSDSRDDVDRTEAKEKIGRLEADLAAEAVLAVELVVDVGLRHAVEPHNLEGVDELRDADERAPLAVGPKALEQHPPRVVVVHETGGTAAVPDRVDGDDAPDTAVVGGGGDRDSAAERPADE